MGRNAAFSILTIGTMMALLVPFAAQRGMFMDGLLYTVVAHNLAEGFGTFWEPRFSQVGFAGSVTFHEHPPLTFGLQSLGFRAMGSGFWVEGLMCILTAALTAWVLVKIWRLIHHREPRLGSMGWLPVLLWIMVPQVHWCFQNNMQENTMGMFTALAVWAVVAWAQAPRIFLMYPAGAAVASAMLAKGIPGAFPLAAPILLGTLWKGLPIAESLKATLHMVLALVIIGLALWLWPDARESLSAYTNNRLLHRIQEAPTVEHRWATLQHLVLAMLGPLSLAGVVVLVWKRFHNRPVPSAGRNVLALTLLGMCGVLPLMLTMVQKSFYMVPALPFLSMSLAAWSAPALADLLDRAKDEIHLVRLVRTLGLLTILGSLLVAGYRWGEASRDPDMLADLDLILGEVPHGSLLTADPDLWSSWNLQSYLMRYGSVSIAVDDKAREWWLTSRTSTGPTGFVEHPLPLRTLKLWRDREMTGAIQ
ncbi:MAG: glycosyltransferase family 39 protein [Flavobacteriales bacterium]|nr:glycosyltransferase family 39 protein [Flavobacteriales bacterium]